jgi:hypothetical protein
MCETRAVVVTTSHPYHATHAPAFHIQTPFLRTETGATTNKSNLTTREITTVTLLLTWSMAVRGGFTGD